MVHSSRVTQLETVKCLVLCFKCDFWSVGLMTVCPVCLEKLFT